MEIARVRDTMSSAVDECIVKFCVLAVTAALLLGMNASGIFDNMELIITHVNVSAMEEARNSESIVVKKDTQEPLSKMSFVRKTAHELLDYAEKLNLNVLLNQIGYIHQSKIQSPKSHSIIFRIKVRDLIFKLALITIIGAAFFMLLVGIAVLLVHRRNLIRVAKSTAAVSIGSELLKVNSVTKA
ncbi:hypothetical protein ACOME3_010166 [Neoechinorhynchus agilis]